MNWPHHHREMVSIVQLLFLGREAHSKTIAVATSDSTDGATGYRQLDLLTLWYPFAESPRSTNSLDLAFSRTRLVLHSSHMYIYSVPTLK